MDLVIDTSDVEFQVSKPFVQRKDKDGNPRRDRQGGTNLLLHAVQLVAWVDGGAETILVSVAIDEPPALAPKSFVKLTRLQAMPWVKDGSPRVAFRAASVVPINERSSKPAAVSPAS
jgi:hypothetical protein